MMTRREAIAALGALVVVTPAFAAEETFKGEMVCAKCYLNKPDAKECQDVLLVKDAKGATIDTTSPRTRWRRNRAKRARRRSLRSWWAPSRKRRAQVADGVEDYEKLEASGLRARGAA